MSQKVVAAVLAGIGLTLLAISGLGFILLGQTTQVAVSEDQARASVANEFNAVQPPAEVAMALGSAPARVNAALDGRVDFGVAQSTTPLPAAGR